MKDWTEDFVHENGNYQNICKICNSKFMGHKIRRVCKECYTQQQVSVEPEVKVNFAEIVKNMKNKIETSLEEFYKENPESIKRKEYHELIKESEICVCDELLKEYNSKISA